MTSANSTTLIAINNHTIGRKAIPAVSARELYTKLGLKRQFANWLDTYTKGKDWQQGHDFEVFNADVKNPEGGRPEKDAALSIEMAEHVAMMTRTTKGREIRHYFRQARDERDMMRAGHALPHVKNPAHQMLIDTIVRLDEVEQRALQAEERATRAETKADMALDETRRMTLEEFVLINGLLRQFPLTRLASYSSWLKDWCTQYNQRIDKAPVLGKSWDKELAYPIQALAAWLRYEQKRPQQITLVREEPLNHSKEK